MKRSKNSLVNVLILIPVKPKQFRDEFIDRYDFIVNVKYFFCHPFRVSLEVSVDYPFHVSVEVSAISSLLILSRQSIIIAQHVSLEKNKNCKANELFK